MKERLQKFLSRAGVASRRKAEGLIEKGTVYVNGKVATLGDQIDPELDEVTLDGKVLTVEQEKIYLMLNKPKGTVTTAKDTHGRKTVLDLVSHIGVRLYPVGRLDLDTEGLLLLTNDGDFAYALTHPKFEVAKVYEALVSGCLSEDGLLRLEKGVVLDDGPTAPAKAKLLSSSTGKSLLRLTIHEGRKRQVKRMCAAIGHPVLELRRVAFGQLQLGTLPLGKSRSLTSTEVAELLRLAGV